MNYELGIMKKAQAHDAQIRFFMPLGEQLLMGNSYENVGRFGKSPGRFTKSSYRFSFLWLRRRPSVNSYKPDK
jgi:hypothetical protein